MPAPGCTYYQNARQSDCLRPVVSCPACINGLKVDAPWGITEASRCGACNGTGGDRCAKHPREEE